MLKVDIDYDYYLTSYCVGQIPTLSAADFEVYVKRAKVFLESISSDFSLDGLEDRVRECLCAISEVLYKNDKHGNIKSESIDGYSVSFADSSNLKSELWEIALRYLGKSGLLYQGVE